ncbi:MAG TPA: hypothetical protein VF119_06630 [Candidatus Limnocylindrales bacterium]
MSRIRPFVLVASLFVVGCGSTPAPSVGPSAVGPSAVATASPATAPPASTPSPSAAAIPSPTAARELVAGSAPLPAGPYTVGAFRPPVIFTVEDGWVAGTVSPGFFDVQQDRGTPDVVAVQFARVDGMVGASGSTDEPKSAEAAAEAIRQNPGVVVIEESGSKVGGLDGLNVTIENQGAAHAPLMKVSAGTLGIDPKRRLWVSLFDTQDGVLAVMVGGSVATWDHALATAEPVLESIWTEMQGTAP